MTKLTQAQIDEFRRHPGTFSEMVQAIYDAGAAAVKESLTPQPAWHDAPTVPGLWICNEGGHNPYRWTAHQVNIPFGPTGERWYGPILEDKP